MMDDKVTLFESWAEHPDGTVTVRRWFEREDGSRVELGDEKTPYYKIPFYMVKYWD